ncbi:MAG: carboxylesterase family protein, partial [Ilumatobacteraceae bacterium]
AATGAVAGAGDPAEGQSRGEGALQGGIFGGLLGACHALELPFVFNTLSSPLAAMFAGADAPQSVADAMHGAWVSFATTGNPGHEGLPAWPRHTADTRPTLLFSPTHEVVEHPNAEELALWEGVL